MTVTAELLSMQLHLTSLLSANNESFSKGEKKVEHRSRAAELRAYFMYLHTAIDYLVHEEVSWNDWSEK
jgi:hypothetical protein